MMKKCGNCKHSVPSVDELDCEMRSGWSTFSEGEACEHYVEKDFLLAIYHWAWAGMDEGDELERALRSTIANAISAYWKEKRND